MRLSLSTLYLLSKSGDQKASDAYDSWLSMYVCMNDPDSTTWTDNRSVVPAAFINNELIIVGLVDKTLNELILVA